MYFIMLTTPLVKNSNAYIFKDNALNLNLLFAVRLVRSENLEDLTAKNLEQVAPTTKYNTKTDELLVQDSPR